MATFNDLICSGKIKSAFVLKQAKLADITDKVQMINDLDKLSPKSRIFSRYETDANESLSELKAAIEDLYILLHKANPDIDNDESYKADLKLVSEQQLLLYKVMDDYIELLHSKGITYPPDIKPVSSSGDLAAILNNLVASQDKNAVAQDKIMTTLDKNLTAMVASQDKNAAERDKNVADLSKNLVDQIKSQSSNNRSGPKAAQPFFSSKNNDSDYGEFNDFFNEI